MTFSPVPYILGFAWGLSKMFAGFCVEAVSDNKTDAWVATAAWTDGLALLLKVLTGGLWTALLLANLLEPR